MKKLWAIVNDNKDLLDYVEASGRGEAVKALVKKWSIPPADAELLDAIPADIVRDDIETPGWLVSALEYGAEYAFGDEDLNPYAWEDYRQTLDKLERKGIRLERVLGWVRVNETFDLWAPVVNPRI